MDSDTKSSKKFLKKQLCPHVDALGDALDVELSFGAGATVLILFFWLCLIIT